MALLTAFLLISLRSGDATISNLRCEYLPSPLGIDAAHPRLSWNTNSRGQNWLQSAYQIIVASDWAKLAKNEGDLWNSGKVNATDSIQIAYDGKKLMSREQCFWKVRVWDKAGNQSPWSSPQTWEMGLLSESDWDDSRWIGGTEDSDPSPAPYLRNEFRCSGAIKRARLFACGLGYAELHLNGQKLGNAVERDPGYTNFDKRVLYVEQDVTEALKPGMNALGAVLGTGWYDVHDLATWHFETAPWRGRPRLRLALFIEYANGQTQTVTSGNTWQTSTGPILFDGIYTGETYDASKEMPGWDAVGFNSANWSPAKEMLAPKGKLAARPCPPVKIIETIKAKSIAQPRPGVYIVDFGQNISGHVKLSLQATAGARITMRYSERVGKDGMIERSEIDTFMKKTAPPQPFQTDTYICKGDNKEEWEQGFSYSGFRYAEVTGFPGKPTLANFSARLATTALDKGGGFSCSSDLLNKIQHATLYSYRSNCQSIPTDCPQREKNGWTGDAQLAAEAGLMNFQSETFYTKWLNDLADDQQASGAMSLIVPSGGWGRGACHPAWDSAYPIVAWDLYKYRGDLRVLRQHYEGMRRYVDFVYKQTKNDVVPFDSLGDWVPWSTQTPSQLTSTIFLFVDARILADSAKLLGDTEDADRYAAMAVKVKAAFGPHFLPAGSLDQASQTALSMAVYFELLDGDERQAAIAALIRNIERQGHLDTGILGAKFVLRTLSEAGRSDIAYRLVARKEQPGWGWWMEQGATTLWEDWKGESSLNHIMFGDVSNWFYQWIAGIGLDPSSPAFKHVLIHPQPVGDLTWAKATENGPYGKIVASWTRNGGKFRLELEVPPNSTATVTMPGVGSDGKLMVMDVGSGDYHFESQLP